MKPLTPETKPPSFARLRKAVCRGALLIFCLPGFFAAPARAADLAPVAAAPGGTWSTDWKDLGITAQEIGASVSVNGTRYPLVTATQTMNRGVASPFGPVTQTLTEFSQPGMPVKVTLRRWEPANDPATVIIQAEITNTQGKPVSLDWIDLASSSKVNLGAAQKDARAMVGLTYPKIIPVLSVKETVGTMTDTSGLSEAATATGGKTDPTRIHLLTATEAAKRGINGKAQPIRNSDDGLVVIAMPDGRSLAMSFIAARHHSPQASVSYDAAADRLALTGRAVFNGVEMAAGQSITTGLLALRADRSPEALLASLESLMLKCGEPARKTPPTIGWCSWYAIRLPLSHDFVMANAKVVTERFRALGMDLMLLDHGWQTGDVCGDWDADPKDFPRGLKGLSADLKKLNLKMGIWVAPTDIHATTRIYANHPDWVLRDNKGQPQSIGQWYWKPNPERYVIDSTQPAAYDYVAQTMRQLVEDGATYFKIDFISQPPLHPKDRSFVRGSAPLERSMQAIRDGAGPAAYVRYCQTPPLNSLGLADGVYSTMDTLDAGRADIWGVLATEFKTSAGQYWRSRLYVHDACDMSVGADGNTEECRLRTMMLLLSGSSIMFSDDLTKLPEERLVMMQQCMPGLLDAARPVNLFTSPTPDIWHLAQDVAGTRNDLVALFNFEEQPREMSVSWEELGLAAGEPRLAREFWTGQFLGAVNGRLTLRVPARSARLFSLWKPENRPQFIGTDLHLTQGAAELKTLKWDAAKSRLTGLLHRAPCIAGHVFVHVPKGWAARGEAKGPGDAEARVIAIPVQFATGDANWAGQFTRRSD